MSTAMTETAEREAMVETQIASRGVRDPRVLAALRKIPRHLFVPDSHRRRAYADDPQPIGFGQTISQPFIVAVMTEALELRGCERVLEIGTGSGYQTAVLAELCAEVFTVETIAALSETARTTLDGLGYKNIRYRVGDGTFGWKEFAPYDGILAAAAPAEVPPALREQLKSGGRLILPVGVEFQELMLITCGERGFEDRRLYPVRFVPLIRSPGINPDFKSG